MCTFSFYFMTIPTLPTATQTSLKLSETIFTRSFTLSWNSCWCLWQISSLNWQWRQKLKYMKIDEGQTSFQVNGTWTGVVGDLVTGEVECLLHMFYFISGNLLFLVMIMILLSMTMALMMLQVDIVVAAMTMTSEREEVIDFVAPYFDQSGISIIIRWKLILMVTIIIIINVISITTIASLRLKRWRAGSMWGSIIINTMITIMITIFRKPVREQSLFKFMQVPPTSSNQFNKFTSTNSNANLS